MDKYLRRLEAVMIVVDEYGTNIQLTGTGDVLESKRPPSLPSDFALTSFCSPRTPSSLSASVPPLPRPLPIPIPIPHLVTRMGREAYGHRRRP
jgi:hypothetical protein